MKKYTIEEVAPECADLSFAFDNDGLTEAGTGDFCGNVFLLFWDRGWRAVLNEDEYRMALEQARSIVDGFGYIRDGGEYATSYKEEMKYNKIKYSPKRCHDLKKWAAADPDPEYPEDLAAFLTITTGRTWETVTGHGYCQGDQATAVFCPDFHGKEYLRALCEIACGAAREYTVTEYGDDGEEVTRCGGYIVADCQAWRDEDVKALVCEWAGIRPEETELRAIDGWSTKTFYEYRTA